MPDKAPTLAGYTAFVRTVAAISTAVLPDGDVGLSDSLFYAERWVPCQLNTIDCYLYTVCVYNMGVSLLIDYQADQSGQVAFKNWRDQFKKNNFVAGVVSSTSDTGTSTTLTVGDALSDLSLFDLQLASDPFGRRALAIMQELGGVWGLS